MMIFIYDIQHMYLGKDTKFQGDSLFRIGVLGHLLGCRWNPCPVYELAELILLSFLIFIEMICPMSFSSERPSKEIEHHYDVIF